MRNQIYRGVPRNTWASHTFNEVYVGGRWVRLNYARLGESPLELAKSGMMIHVNTMRDWSDSIVSKTWGEYAQRDDGPFRLASSRPSPNPYRTLALRDELGARADIANPHEPLEEIDPDARFELGFDFERSRASKKIVGLRAGSAAARAGLREGQPLAGAAFSGNPNEEATIRIREGDAEKVVTFFPRSTRRAQK
jgi:hypothetical protein